MREASEAAGFSGVLETYLIHGGPEWPWPLGATLGKPFEPHDAKGEWIPPGVPWPPTHRVKLTPKEARIKARTIQAHSSHLVPVLAGSLAEERVFLESFGKSDEIFWSTSVRSGEER